MFLTKYKNFERAKEFPDKPIYKMDLKQFQPIRILNSKINYFDKIDLDLVSYKKIRGMLMEIIDGIELKMPSIHCPQIIYRGRIFSPDNEVISNKEQFWYPKKEYIQSRGRVNKKEEIIFYGATSFYSILSEIDVKIGKTFVIGEIELVNPQKTKQLIQLGFTKEILESIGIPEDQIIQITSVENELMKSPLYIDKIPISDYSESLLFLKFFSKYMAMKKDDTSFYKITNAIAEAWFLDQQLAGISYPNINTNYYKDMDNTLMGYNVALRPKDVDELYKAKRVWILKLQQRDNNKLYLEMIKSSETINEKGNIFWAEDPTLIKLPIETTEVIEKD